MPFIPVANCQQCELIYLWAGQTVETVLHYRTPSPATAGDQVVFAASMVNWYATKLQPLHHSSISLVDVKITDLSSASAPVTDFTTGLPLAGAGGADGLPNSVALVITKRTALRGRSYRGRIYHGGIGEGNCAGNQIVGAHVTALLTAYNFLKAITVGAATYTLCVLSRAHNNVPLTAGVLTDVVSLSSDGFVDSQRRRLPGRGA